jgi:hypothetical protein
MPVKAGTIDPSVSISASSIYAQSGMFTYDPGLTSTASCESEITYIHGDEGVLLYRGYPIEQIAEHGDFLETRKLPGFRAMTKTPKTGYARLAGPDIFGIAMRGKLSAIGRVNPPQPMFRGGEASGEGCSALPAIILLSIS